jgi:chromosome segregation ATPase
MATKEKKKSKLEKIYELQATNKGLKEENRSLRKQLQATKGADGRSQIGDDRSISSANNEEKLLEAMKALKRVTVKQEMSLNTIRSKAEHRRKQISERDETIKSLQQEVDNLKLAQEARKQADGDGDIDNLRSKVEDLELRCAEQENRNKMLTLQLEASEDKANSLQKQLNSARGLMGREPSSRSLKSSETSSSEYDLARMRKELAAKIEKIVLLEFDLEMCKDELHELKQKQMRSDAFPAQQVEENPTDYQDEFFSDEEDEDEIW